MIMPQHQTKLLFTNTQTPPSLSFQSHHKNFKNQKNKTMFDPQTELPLNHSNPSDHNHFSYDSYGARIKKTVQKYDTYRSWNHNNGSGGGGGGGGGVRFYGDDGNDEESGVCSPPLWKASSPNHHHNQQQQQQNNYRYLSPAQKSQAVANGQRELMEMIRNMPESSYELSLKDLVEYPRIEARHENVPREMLSDVTSFDDEAVLNLKDEKDEKKKKKKSGKKKGQATMRRSGSIDSGGFLLKMVFPFPWGSSNKNKMMMKKKKTMNNIAPDVSSTCSKVSPRPSTTLDKSKILDGSEKSVVDKEWWKKKRLSNSRDSESGGLSSINSGSTGSSGSSSSTRSNSNSNNSRNRRIFSPGCWSFFRINKGKNHK